MPTNMVNCLDQWLAARYGSRRGYIRTIWYRIRYMLGGYSDFKQIDWGSVDRVVFVCKGNICRSAFAEAVARSHGIHAVSCGVDTRNNFPANDDAIITAGTKGINLDGHRTLAIQSLDFRKNDLFIAMEPWQAERVMKDFGCANRCSLLGLWGTPVSPHIQDPLGAPEMYFNNCFSYIERSVNEVARKIKESS